jgi:hypothetical protein
VQQVSFAAVLYVEQRWSAVQQVADRLDVESPDSFEDARLGHFEAPDRKLSQADFAIKIGRIVELATLHDEVDFVNVTASCQRWVDYRVMFFQ